MGRKKMGRMRLGQEAYRERIIRDKKDEKRWMTAFDMADGSRYGAKHDNEDDAFAAIEDTNLIPQHR